MRKFIIFLILITIPLAGFSKEYLNAAVKINLKDGLILGVLEIDGKQQVFNFELKDADYNDGHTFVIYKDWLPEIPYGYGLRMHIFSPEGFMLVTESNRSKETYTGTRYEYDNPEHGVTLAFSDRWLQETVEYKGVDISTFFTIKNRMFTQAYFDRIKELLDLYTEKLGAYPYSSFNVVDVPYPAGHALKSMTFISTNIIGMPFLTDISLGHELVHQWLGVAVDADIDGGNWAEALTTYYADRLYAQQKGEGLEYRKNALKNYMANARQKEDGTCLMGFEYNKDRTAQAVGYSKGMMAFTMLETILGTENFDKSVRIFVDRYKHEKASWEDLILIMEDMSGIVLTNFLDGWLTETALAEFYIKDVKVNGAFKGYSVSFDLVNKYEWLEYPLSVLVKTDKGDIYDYLYINSKDKKVEIKTEGKPTEIIFDPEYKTARLLSDEETTPVLYHLYSKYEKAVFVNPAEREKYESVISTLENAVVVDDTENPYKYMNRILVFMGDENAAYSKIYKNDMPVQGAEFIVKSVNHPMGSPYMSYVIAGADKETVASNARRISHYGKYSSLTLTAGHRYDKAIDDSFNGYRYILKGDEQGVAVQKNLTIKDIAGLNTDKNLFFIGEKHDEFAHHENQYQFIKTLYEEGRDLAIGLEQVQRPFQEYLDAYIAGDIDEAEMIRGTEYYSRWGFDFRLYKKIFDFAREKGISLVALNLEAEITKMVSAKGINSLDEKYLAKIPTDIEYTTGHYMDRLKKIFMMHESRRSFNNFYEAQLLWDETMAESAAKYMQANPEKTFVVIAGNGHLEYGYGIPDRVKRRTGADYALVVQDMDYIDGIGDYILYPEEMGYEASPKMGVMVDETDDGLLVKKVFPDSIASGAGIEKGDYIIDFNGIEIFELDDIRLALMYAQKDKSYKFKVQRGDETVSLTATF